MIVVEILIPLTSNEGAVFTAEHHVAFEAHLIAAFGGYSLLPGTDTAHGMTPCGILLDPPYAHAAGREKRVYREDPADVSTAVRAWALANGDNPALRIALCGWEGEHTMPPRWTCITWRPQNAYQNAHRERIWFSPHCLLLDRQADLFTEAS